MLYTLVPSHWEDNQLVGQPWFPKGLGAPRPACLCLLHLALQVVVLVPYLESIKATQQRHTLKTSLILSQANMLKAEKELLQTGTVLKLVVTDRAAVPEHCAEILRFAQLIHTDLPVMNYSANAAALLQTYLGELLSDPDAPFVCPPRGTARRRRANRAVQDLRIYFGNTRLTKELERDLHVWLGEQSASGAEWMQGMAVEPPFQPLYTLSGREAAVETTLMLVSLFVT